MCLLVHACARVQAGSQLKTLQTDLLPFLRPCCTRFMAMLDGPDAGEHGTCA